jgi:molecular chaperone GrpE
MGDEENQQVDNVNEPATPSTEADQEYDDMPLITNIDDLPDDDDSKDESFDPSAADVVAVEDAPASNDRASAAVISEYESKVAAIAAELETLKAQYEDRNAQYVRLVADFENFRRRTNREKEEQEEKVKCSTVMELLSVVDNFERARSQIKPQTESEMAIHKSYQGVYKQLVDGLKRIGVSPMRAEGCEFDPNLHDAVMREQTADHEEGIVMEELMRGYMLGDRVLRHAMVKVAAAPDPVIPSDEDSEPHEAPAPEE